MATINPVSEGAFLIAQPQQQKKDSDRKICCFVSCICFVTFAGGIGGAVGLVSCNEIGDNPCTILSSTAIGIGGLALLCIKAMCLHAMIAPTLARDARSAKV